MKARHIWPFAGHALLLHSVLQGWLTLPQLTVLLLVLVQAVQPQSFRLLLLPCQEKYRHQRAFGYEKQ